MGGASIMISQSYCETCNNYGPCEHIEVRND